MSDLEIKVRVLGYHLEEGELSSASAAKEVIAHFQSDLVKANERIAELEGVIASASCLLFDLDKMDVDSEEYADGKRELLLFFLEDEYALRISRKFAIEQKIEGAFSFADYLDKSNFSAAIAAKESGFFQIVETFTEQLRKEQDGEQ